MKPYYCVTKGYQFICFTKDEDEINKYLLAKGYNVVLTTNLCVLDNKLHGKYDNYNKIYEISEEPRTLIQFYLSPEPEQYIAELCPAGDVKIYKLDVVDNF